MADITQKIIFDDSQIIKSLSNQVVLTEKLNGALEQTEKNYQTAFLRASAGIESSNQAIANATNQVGKHILATNKAKQASGGWRDALKSLSYELNIGGKNLGAMIEGLRTKATAMKTVVGAVNTGTGAMKAFKVALISTGIGALVVLLGTLVSWLGKGEKATKEWNVVLAILGSFVDVATRRVLKLADAVTNLSKGNFKAAFNDAKDAVSGLSKELHDAGVAAAELEIQAQKLEESNRALAISNAEQAGQIAKLLNLAYSEGTTLKEKIGYLEKVNELEKESAAQAAKNAWLAYQIEFNKQIKQTIINKEDQIRLADLYIAATLAQNAVDEVQLTGIKRITAAKEEQAAKDEAARQRALQLNEELQTQIDKIIDASARADRERLSPSERLFAEQEVAKGQIEELFKVLDEKAKAAGKEVDLSEEKANLLKFVEEQFQKDLLNLRREGLEKDKLLREEAAKERLEFEKTQAEKRLNIIGNEMRKSAEAQRQNAENFKSPLEEAFDSIKVKLADVFGVKTNEDLNVILDAFGQSFQSLTKVFTADTEAAIDRNNELIESLKERAEALDEELEKELERQEAGLANNVAGKRAEIEAIKKEEAAAQKEAEKLKKKQLAQQLINDSISQGSSIVTMATNISERTSLLGPAGIPVALATIAAFLAIISKIKASQKKLYTGGALEDSGFVNLNGRTDKNGGRGHRIEDSNIVVGGKEFIVAEGPAQKHRELLEAINRGEFDSSSGLHFAMGYNKQFEHDSTILAAIASKSREFAMATAIDQAVGKHIGRLETTLKKIPRRTSYKPGDIIIEETDNEKKFIQTEGDWRWKP